MASLDSLPPDQRAVLQLVLQRARGYDEIARMLSIDRAGVRERALAAFDALGPTSRVPAQRRALITDYLLGQLPEQVSEQTRRHLAQSAPERAWARVVASEIGTIASQPLPEIPTSLDLDEEPKTPDRPAEPADAADQGTTPRDVPSRAAAGKAATTLDDGTEVAVSPSPRLHEDRPEDERPASRRAGALLLGLVGLLAVAALVIVLVATSGGDKKHHSATTAAKPPTPTTRTGAQLIAQVNLVAPAGVKKSAGIAQVVRQGANLGVIIAAQGMPQSTGHDAYAVWLYNSPSDESFLGFVTQRVKADGKLETFGTLPASASRYKQLLVTLETQAKPHGPGKIQLEGALSLS